MKLTPTQIDQLYTFTRQHYVEYYDLQTELVDHLANAIEEQWQENPKLSFDDALNIEFKKFGVLGFTELINKRRKALRNKYFRIVGGHFKDFFKWPKIVGTLFAIILLNFITKTYLVNVSLSTHLHANFIIIFIFFFVFFAGNIENQKLKANKYRWLFKEIILSTKYFPLILTYLLYVGFENLMLHYPNLFKSELYSVLFSIILVCWGLFCYITYKVIPSKVEEYLKQTYPEYEFVS